MSCDADLLPDRAEDRLLAILVVHGHAVGPAAAAAAITASASATRRDERLLADHVRAGREHLDAQLGMGVGRRRDDDDVRVA